MKRDLEIENVYFMGELNRVELNMLYEESTVFFLPSHHEQFGIVFAEAMAHGLPVIAPNHSAIPEVVDEGGIIYRHEDIEDCLKAFDCLLNSQERWKLYSDKAKQIIGERLDADYSAQYARKILEL